MRSISWSEQRFPFVRNPDFLTPDRCGKLCRNTHPPNPKNRAECACYITGDIGANNTCGHLCRYCYANADKKAVLLAMKQHDPDSPMLIGHPGPDDIIRDAKQESWIDPQLRMNLLSYSR